MFYDFLVRRLSSDWEDGKNFGAFWTNCFHKALWDARGGRRQRWNWAGDEQVWSDYECQYLPSHHLARENAKVFLDPETGQTYIIQRLETRKLAHYNPHARFMG